MSIVSPYRAFAGVDRCIATDIGAAHVAARCVAGMPMGRRAQAAAVAAAPPAVTAFLVKYRGGHPRMDARSLHGVLRDIEAGFIRPAGLRRVRRDAKGADMIHTARALDRVEADALIERMLVEPGVEYVVCDDDTRRIDARIDSALGPR